MMKFDFDEDEYVDRIELWLYTREIRNDIDIKSEKQRKKIKIENTVILVCLSLIVIIIGVCFKWGIAS